VQHRIEKEPFAMRRLASSISLLTALALGCVEPPADDQVASTEQAVIECDTWICGSNSPIIDTLFFHELNTRGLANAQGFVVTSLRQSGIDYTLYVERGKIIGRMGSLPQLQGAALKDAEIRLRLGSRVFAIRITAVGSVQTFARLLGSTRTLETYQLDTTELLSGVPSTAGWTNLCSNPPSRDNPDVQGMNVFQALVFEGERIDAASKTINTALDASWFNIGCAGHALAKMAVNGETEAARQAFGFQTTISDRQTFLKMVSGDYCGKGHSFTVSGEPLQWKDSHGYTNYVTSPLNLQIEARWSPSGATCLNQPRVLANPTPLAQSTFISAQAFQQDLTADCNGQLPPPCVGSVTDLAGQLFVSANP
jgi:hypothetical protein